LIVPSKKILKFNSNFFRQLFPIIETKYERKFAIVLEGMYA